MIKQDAIGEDVDAKAARQARQLVHLERAIAMFPSLAAFSRAINARTYQLVQGWRKTEVPIKYCARIERATSFRVKKRELREDWDDVTMGRC